MPTFTLRHVSTKISLLLHYYRCQKIKNLIFGFSIWFYNLQFYQKLFYTFFIKTPLAYLLIFGMPPGFASFFLLCLPGIPIDISNWYPSQKSYGFFPGTSPFLLLMKLKNIPSILQQVLLNSVSRFWDSGYYEKKSTCIKSKTRDKN